MKRAAIQFRRNERLGLVVRSNGKRKMRELVRRTAIVAVLAVGGIVAGATSAFAVESRVVVVVAGSKADYQNNVAVLPAIVRLLKSVKVLGVSTSTDPAGLSVTISSMWFSPTDIISATESPQWKATTSRLRCTNSNPCFPLVP
jgi:hypothetical protein